MEPVYTKLQQNEQAESVQQADEKIAAKHAEAPPNVTIYAVREDTSSDVKHLVFQIIMFSMGFMFFLPWIVGALVPRCVRKTDKMHAVEKALYYSNVVMSIFSVIVIALAIVIGLTLGDHDGMDFHEMHHEHHFGHHRHFLF